MGAVGAGAPSSVCPTVITAMALAGTPEPPTRALPSAWTSLDGGNVVQEAQEALEAYKKKDANKGASSPASGSCVGRRRAHSPLSPPPPPRLSTFIVPSVGPSHPIPCDDALVQSSCASKRWGTRPS